jgi:hypothetical protein
MLMSCLNFLITHSPWGPSNSQTSHLFSSSLSFGLPFPRSTQCVWRKVRTRRGPGSYWCMSHPDRWTKRYVVVSWELPWEDKKDRQIDRQTWSVLLGSSHHHLDYSFTFRNTWRTWGCIRHECLWTSLRVFSCVGHVSNYQSSYIDCHVHLWCVEQFLN